MTVVLENKTRTKVKTLAFLKTPLAFFAVLRSAIFR